MIGATWFQVRVRCILLITFSIYFLELNEYNPVTALTFMQSTFPVSDNNDDISLHINLLF